MSSRKIPFVDGESYHVFNRGIARQPVFLHKREYGYFLLALDFYRYSKPPVRLSRFLEFDWKRKIEVRNLMENGNKDVEILSYTLMPNHFHLMIKQLVGRGISTFLSKVTNSYTRFFNIRNNRVGDLFQGVFKSVLSETEEQSCHLSRYIHLNPVVSNLVGFNELADYPWSSYKDYLKGSSNLVDVKTILSLFRSPKQYEEFVLDQAEYAKRLKELRYLALD